MQKVQQTGLAALALGQHQHAVRGIGQVAFELQERIFHAPHCGHRRHGVKLGIGADGAGLGGYRANGELGVVASYRVKLLNAQK